MKLGTAIAEIMKREGIEILCGYPVNHLIEHAANADIRPIMVRQERIGLHMADIELLLSVLHRLVDEGNTVLVIEHNVSVIAEADYIVDLGPEAGDAGGEVVACGTPEEVAKNRLSRTAPFLRKVLKTTRGKNARSS